MNLTVQQPAVPPAAAGPAMKWLWGAIGVLGISVVALGATLVLRQPPPAVAQAPRTPEAQIIDEKQPEVLMNRPQAAINSEVKGGVPASLGPQVIHRSSSPSMPALRPVRAPAPACPTCGRIESVQAVQQAAPATGVGAVAGGVLGAVVGNQVGKGHGRTAATLLGAVGGGYVGHQVEQRTRTHTVYDVAVRMDDGSVRRFQRAQPTAVGTPVVLQGKGFRVDQGGDDARNAAPYPMAPPRPVRVADTY